MNTWIPQECSCKYAMLPWTCLVGREAEPTFSCWIVSLALASFSWLASTIFHAFSISFFRAAMVDWSSSFSFRAVCTLAALATISALSSRHFFTRRFSLSARHEG